MCGSHLALLKNLSQPGTARSPGRGLLIGGAGGRPTLRSVGGMAIRLAYRAARSCYLRMEAGPLSAVVGSPAVRSLKCRITKMPAGYVPGVQQALRAAGVQTWIAGGWGVDALVGHQTRRHYDLDLIIRDDPADRAVVARLLSECGFRPSPVDVNSTLAMPVRCEWHDDQGHVVEVMPVDLTRPPFGSLSAGSPVAKLFDRGTIDHREVDCISAALQLALHTGYQQRREDGDDLAQLRELAR